MSSIDLRQSIAEACEKYDSQYAQLVKPINKLLMDIDALISEETAKQIMENLQLFHSGDKYIADCHLDESESFMKDGLELIKKGDLPNGAIQMFGAGLNFASYAMRVAGHKNVNKHKQLDEAFRLIMNSFK